jgi:RNA polymerase sigma factor (sigma-70 family)
MTSTLSLLTPTALARETDERLVELVRAGSDAAFAAIHDRYREALSAYARRLLGSHADDAEDVVQDSFMRALRSMRSSERNLALKPWLYTIVRNRAVDHLRRPGNHNLELLDDIHEALPEQHDPHTRTVQRERMLRVVGDIAGLPERQRRALVLRELNGASYREVAKDLQVSLPATKSLLVRARGNLVEAAAARDAGLAPAA